MPATTDCEGRSLNEAHGMGLRLAVLYYGMGLRLAVLCYDMGITPVGTLLWHGDYAWGYFVMAWGLHLAVLCYTSLCNQYIISIP